MQARILTVTAPASAQLVEKKSRFIGNVRPAPCARDAALCLEEIRAEHPEARHCVFAYVTELGAVRRASDDGEPQGTGGAPLMELLTRENLTNVCLTVTRYFGGVLLGAGPLARAYGKAARLTLSAAAIVACRLFSEYTFTVPYPLAQRAKAALNRLGARQEPPAYAGSVTLHFYIPAAQKQELLALCADLSAGQIEPVCVGERYLEE